MSYLIWLPCIAAILFAIGNFYFTDESCLPHKRKMENMLETIRVYQRRKDLSCVEIDYKGKHFKVSVEYTSPELCYGYYNVYINGNHVKTFHVLKHLYSKSREDKHVGDMREYEEYEIIKATYKHIKKLNNESFNERWDKSSYFN